MKSEEQLLKELKELYIEQSNLLDKKDIGSIYKYKFNRNNIGFLENVLQLDVY